MAKNRLVSASSPANARLRGGDLYPCFMFAGIDEVRLGNIFDFDEDDFRKRREDFIRASRKSNREDCGSCWAANICGGCMGSAFWASGRLTGNDPSWCEFQRETIAYVAEKIARLHSDKMLWQRLADAFKNATYEAEQRGVIV
ncbi:MAG: SPASM domain-containing protein [Firmicutes bacterium]|nr:SPASM domain-containing protein [Candidatus Fermentithermobacillaceae bacterium]